MVSLTAIAVKKPNPVGEPAIQQILAKHPGNHFIDLCNIANEIGVVRSVNGLSDDRAREVVLHEFNRREIDDIHWSMVHGAFLNALGGVTTLAYIKEMYRPPVAGNDNKPISGRATFAQMLSDRADPSSIAFADGSKLLQVPDQVRAVMKDRFQVTWFDDVNNSPAKEEIVKGLIGAGEFSLWVAKPGTAKSVLLCDIGCHIAAGKDWHGKAVKQGLVVFFAAERKSLTERRIAAWRKKHDVTGIPFAVVGGKLDLTANAIDAKALAVTIKALEAKSGLPCHLVILDTVTRTFGAGDQNSSKDMQRYIQSADELNRATGAHVAAIHHSGWVGDRGKGAVDLDGAVDVSYGISVVGKGPSKVFRLECTGANDGDEGDITSFRLDSVELGTDADGNVTTAPVVVQVDGSKHDGSNLKGNTGKALEALERAIEEHGETPPDDTPGFPSGVVTASREHWRVQFYADVRDKEPDIKEDALKRRFSRAVLDLTNAKEVEVVGEWFWPAGQT